MDEIMTEVAAAAERWVRQWVALLPPRRPGWDDLLDRFPRHGRGKGYSSRLGVSDARVQRLWAALHHLRREVVQGLEAGEPVWRMRVRLAALCGGAFIEATGGGPEWDGGLAEYRRRKAVLRVVAKDRGRRRMAKDGASVEALTRLIESRSYLEAVSTNRNLPQALWWRLAEDATLQWRLAQNPSAPVAGLEMLAATSPTLAATVARHPAITHEMRAALATHADRGVRMAVMGCPCTTDALLQQGISDHDQDVAATARKAWHARTCSSVEEVCALGRAANMDQMGHLEQNPVWLRHAGFCMARWAGIDGIASKNRRRRASAQARVMRAAAEDIERRRAAA